MSALVSDAQNVRRRRFRRRLLAVVAVVVILDLATKAWASAALRSRDIEMPGPLDLRLSHNPGVAFGLGDALPTGLLLVLTATVVIALGVAAWRGAFTNPIAIGLILGGAVANLADRLQAGTVVDMLHTGWWPSFNIADTCITIGATLLVIGQLRADSEPDVRSSDGA